jgi:hypothetical protein
MESYDPLNNIDPKEWLDLSEEERLDLVLQYHFTLDIDLPIPEIHASMHVVVENQIAMDDELPVKMTLDRLIKEGLDRHEAIHAIASVLAGDIFDLMQGRKPTFDNDSYEKSLNELTAKKWLKSAQGGDLI